MPRPEQNIGMQWQALKPADLDLIQWLGLAVKETKLIKPVRQGSRKQGWVGGQTIKPKLGTIKESLDLIIRTFSGCKAQNLQQNI